MSRKKKNETASDVARNTEAAAEEASLDVTADPEPEQPPTPEQRIAQLEQEQLRLQAELQNVAKRAQREKQEALRYAEADFAKELLVILDDLERTAESAKTAPDVAAVTEGVRIVYEHFLKVLRGLGIEPIEAKEKQFNPDLHEALLQQPSEQHPAGIVLQEFLRGYVMRGRVIRPTKVVVSSGAPDAAAQTQPSDEEKGETHADL